MCQCAGYSLGLGHGRSTPPHPLPRSGVRRQSPANVARRLKAASSTANEKLEKLDIEPISDRVPPRSLRRTFASIRAASGDDPVYIAEQLGHTDPRFTLTAYTNAVKRRAKLSGAYLAECKRALAWAAVATAEWAATGSETARLREGLAEVLSNLA